jgi:hypothetical protein
MELWSYEAMVATGLYLYLIFSNSEEAQNKKFFPHSSSQKYQYLQQSWLHAIQKTWLVLKL